MKAATMFDVIEKALKSILIRLIYILSHDGNGSRPASGQVCNLIIYFAGLMYRCSPFSLRFNGNCQRVIGGPGSACVCSWQCRRARVGVFSMSSCHRSPHILTLFRAGRYQCPIKGLTNSDSAVRWPMGKSIVHFCLNGYFIKELKAGV